MARSRCIALVAGEASGDAIGAELIPALRQRLPDVRLVGIGGPKMIAAGLESWYPQEQLAVRGLVEVLRHLPRILGIRAGLKRRLRETAVDLYVGIDAPDFNLPVERWLKRRGVGTVHYVSPTVWGWRSGRLKTIRAAVSRMLVLFPFEEGIYRRAGIDVRFVGHPLAEQIPLEDPKAGAREALRLSAAAGVIAMLPGSRMGEISLMAPVFIETALQIHAVRPDVRFIVPFISGETRRAFEQILYALEARHLPMTLLYGHAQQALAAADLALVASGTATLEAALLRRAMVVAYRLSPLTYALLRVLVKVKAVALPNLLLGEFAVPELLQAEADSRNLSQALLNLLADAGIRERLAARFALLHQMLRPDAAHSAAEVVLSLLEARA